MYLFIRTLDAAKSERRRALDLQYGMVLFCTDGMANIPAIMHQVVIKISGYSILYVEVSSQPQELFIKQRFYIPTVVAKYFVCPAKYAGT